MTEKPAWALRSILSRAEQTQTGEVKPIRDWDTMASTIRQAQNYLVITEAEEARCIEALDEARTNKANAERMLDEAKALWIKTSADILGIGMKEQATCPDATP